MYSSSSLYSSPYSSSYLPTKTYSSSLPPKYVPSYSASSHYSSSKLPLSTYSNGSSYRSALSDSSSWRSTYTPTTSRRESTTLPRRPSFSSSNGSIYRSSSITPSSADLYKPSSYVSSIAKQDEWVPRSRFNSISSTSPPKQSLQANIYTNSSNTGTSYNTTSEVNKLAGRVGLHNLGNTCFMNAVLQCLCHTRPLVEYCKRGSFSSEINPKSSTGGDLIKAFSSLISVLWKDSHHNAVSPDNLKRELQKYAPRFAGCNQQDAQELLRYLLHGLHDDINRVTTKTTFRSYSEDYMTDSQKATESWRRYQSTDDSKIVDIFGGQLKSTLKCEECKNTSVTFDPFWDLSLPIPEGGTQMSLQQCFRQFTLPEVLDGSEKPWCEKCKKKTKSTKQFEINKFPPILVIHLKRFSSGINYRNKLNVSVDYNLKCLDLSRFASSNCMNSNSTYDLYGVVDHFGTSCSGHYTSKCKNPYTDEWNEFNDRMVIDVSTSSLVTDKAYLLFYEQTKSRRSSRF